MNRTIRLFVSSTFSDFKAERDLLQREVFPKLQHRLDDNAVPPEYVLKPRTGRFVAFAVWSEEVERALLAALELYGGGYEPAAAREQQAHSACCTGGGQYSGGYEPAAVAPTAVATGR